MKKNYEFRNLIKLGYSLSRIFAKYSEKSEMNSKFKIGDSVRYIGDNKDLGAFKNKVFKVTAFGRAEGNNIEYSLEDFPYLVWEDEIVKEI